MNKLDRDSFRGPITANSFSGLPTFFRRHASKDFEAADIVVYGLPNDLGTSNRPGARFGPRAIREASLQLSWGDVWPWGFDPFEKLAVIDAGDIEYPYGQQQEFTEAAQERAREVARADAVPFSLGGDHNVTYGSLKGVSEVVGPVALLHFDAHSDTSIGPDTQHGTMFRHALNEGNMIAQNSLQIGIRTAYCDDDAILRLHAPEVMSRAPDEIAGEIVERVGDAPCYLSFDIDCLDPAFAPATGTPIPGGLSTLHVLDVFRALPTLQKGKRPNIVGLDLVEVAPSYDHAQMTSLAAAQIAQELICLIASLSAK